MESRRRLLLSFSGGETSAFMTWICLNSEKVNELYDEKLVIFANTGQENEATLDFVKACDRKFKFKTVWIEAVTDPGYRKPTRARVVNYKTADRTGAVFEEMIKKYGIPGGFTKHCSRSLKAYPIMYYTERMHGWEKGSYDTAIGIRADEVDRVSLGFRERNLVYPLIQWVAVAKPDVNVWWSKQSFRLKLKGYQGNCKWCWKKSMRKHLTLMEEDPSIFDFPERMEELYPYVGAEFRPESIARRGPVPKDYKRVFFRGSLSTKDLRRIYDERKDTFKRATDDAVVYSDDELDLSNGCIESCEVFGDE